MIEQLAAEQHEIWSHWMRYLFEVSETNHNGTVTIPADKVSRWKLQMETQYCDMSPKEQVSDLEMAQRVVVVLKDGCVASTADPEAMASFARAVSSWAEKPEYLNKERHEHEVFQAGTQGPAHAMARELWIWSAHLERDNEQYRRESRGLQQTILRLEELLKALDKK